MDFSDIKNLLDEMIEWRIPGNCIVVYKGREKLFEYCSGYSVLKEKVPMTPDKLFNIYSCTKVATCAAALQLYEKGLFLLDTPVYEFIPEFRDIKVKKKGEEERAPASPVTMRHLFTHTSGLKYDLLTENVRKVKEETSDRMDTLPVIRGFIKDGLSFDPGEKFQYSLSHDVLAGVVEVISGMRFRDYMKKNIFEPLEMDSACFDNEDVKDKVAEQYSFWDKKHISGKWKENAEKYGIEINGGYLIRSDHRILSELKPGPEYDSGGAGITVSVPDFAKLTAALASEGSGPNGERILSKGTVRLMMTNQMRGKLFDPKTGYGYCLGAKTLVDKAKAGRISEEGEFGWPGAAGSMMMIDTQTGISLFYGQHVIAAMTNNYELKIKNAVYKAIR